MNTNRVRNCISAILFATTIILIFTGKAPEAIATAILFNGYEHR